jgi:hypothetical protein
MSGSEKVKQWIIRVHGQTQAAFVRAATLAHESIVNGSPITGAPGQPVDTGNLRASWQLFFESKESAIIGTNVEYAQAVEDGVGRDGQRAKYGQGNPAPGRARMGPSTRGGSHSLKLTRAGFNRILAQAARDVDK